MLGGHKIAGVVVIFNSRIEVVDNIRTYLPHLDALFVVDNSPEPDTALVGELQRLPKVHYIAMGKNTGIAHAFNVGAERALDQQCEFILTMDDDSRAAPDMMDQFSKLLYSMTDIGRVGIVSPNHCYKNYSKDLDTDMREVGVTISSGSLINLQVYQKTGPFLEALFVDYVDFEYCLRLREHGFRILRAGEAILYHELGELVSRNVLGVRVGVTRHSPMRMYYRTRNRFFVARKYFFRYPRFVLRDLVIFVNELIKIVLFESGRKEKFVMIARGLMDFLSGSIGEYRAR